MTDWSIQRRAPHTAEFPRESAPVMAMAFQFLAEKEQETLDF
jgi:hypothetical protein